jgi:hypothetical protein
MYCGLASFCVLGFVTFHGYWLWCEFL